MTRLLTILLLIVLLPLRGWAVERMADHMAAGATTTYAMPADCPMMNMVQAAPAADTDSSDDSETPSPTEHTCQACQLCMSLAAPQTAAVQTVSPAPQIVAVHPADNFASADLPQVNKPPIS